MRPFILFFFNCLATFSIFAQSGSAVPSLDSLSAAELRQHAMALDSMVLSMPNKQVSSFPGPDSTSLPVGIVKEINGFKYVICIDSARYTPTGASFDVYMSIIYPGTDNGRLAFYAKRVPFNPNGIAFGTGAIQLQLAGDHTLTLGPKNKIVFKGDGSNFVLFGCNGYESMGINADIYFDKGFIHTPSNGQVIANLQANVEDINDVVFQTSISPFEVDGLDDYIFTVNDLTIDRSNVKNATNCNLPIALSSVLPAVEEWKGFFANTLSLTLPPKFNKGGAPTTIGVKNLFIDDQGVTGDFFAANIFGINEGKMDSWTFSLDSIRLSLLANKLTKGSLRGSVSVPDLNNADLAFKASIFQTPQNSLNYDFSVIIDSSMSYDFPALSATLNLKQGSSISVFVADSTFIPSMYLNGNLTINTDKVSLNSIAFQNLKIVTYSPYLISGTFALTASNKNNVAKLPISLTELSIGLSSTQIVFNVGLLVSLGGENSTNSFSCSGGVKVITQRAAVPNSTRTKLAFDRISVNNINLSIETQPFSLVGVIVFKEDDPVFGKLFFGSIAFKINNDKIMEDWASVTAGFGKINGKKYWYADASVPVNIPMGAVSITNLFGGVQYGVRSTLTSTEKLDRAFNQALTNTVVPNVNMQIPFVPDSTLGLGFSAGVALISTTGESLFNGEALFGILFNANGGLANISLDGRAYFMTKRAFRNAPANFKGIGLLVANYNHNDRILHAVLSANLEAPNVLYGTATVTLHVDTNDWYFWLNRPASRCSVNVVNIFTATAYFMVGTQIDPIPAPPAYVTNLVSTSPIISTNSSDVSSGQGFATGMQLGVDFSGEFPKNRPWRGYVECQVGGGFDVTMYKMLPGTHCSNSTELAGMNGWYINGQVYVYLNGALGAKKYKDNGDILTYKVGSIAMAALLQGRLPKPTFVYGAVGFNVTLLNLIDFSFDAEFAFGNDCTLVSN